MSPSRFQSNQLQLTFVSLSSTIFTFFWLFENPTGNKMGRSFTCRTRWLPRSHFKGWLDLQSLLKIKRSADVWRRLPLPLSSFTKKNALGEEWLLFTTCCWRTITTWQTTTGIGSTHWSCCLSVMFVPVWKSQRINNYSHRPHSRSMSF